MWTEVDSRISFLLQNALQNFSHELLVDNFVGIPTLLQHGSADDNVPAFHSRRMNQLIGQSASVPSSNYVELDNKGHWFDGVMTTDPLKEFYHDVLSRATRWPAVPTNFGIVVSNPAEMGSRGGLAVDQLKTPGRLGRIEVRRSPSMDNWSLRTSNIRRFHILQREGVNLPSEVEIDEEIFKLPLTGAITDTWFVRSEDGHWQVHFVLPIRSPYRLTPPGLSRQHLAHARAPRRPTGDA